MDELLKQIDDFITQHGLSERQFGELSLNDKNFVADIRDKRSPSLRTVGKVRDFMATYTPTQAAA